MGQGKSDQGSPKVFIGIPWLRDNNEYEPYLESCLEHLERVECPEADVMEPFITEQLDPSITFTSREQMAWVTPKLNELINKFLRTDATHLWFINADTEVPPSSLSKLLRWNADLASGVSPGHGSAIMSTVMRWYPPASPEFAWSTPYYKPLKMEEVLGNHFDNSMFTSATGHFCLLVSRFTFDHLRFWWSPEHKLGSEILFWSYASNLGLRCVIDGSILCGHLPQHPLVELEKTLGWSN